MRNIDHATALRARWDRWPRRGRRNITSCEHAWFQLFVGKSEEEAAALLAEIDAGITRWLASREFAQGYVHGLDRYLVQRRWEEDPEPARQATPADGWQVPAPPSEWRGVKLNYRCMCGTCASCKVMPEVLGVMG